MHLLISITSCANASSYHSMFLEGSIYTSAGMIALFFLSTGKWKPINTPVPIVKFGCFPFFIRQTQPSTERAVNGFQSSWLSEGVTNLQKPCSTNCCPLYCYVGGSTHLTTIAVIAINPKGFVVGVNNKLYYLTLGRCPDPVAHNPALGVPHATGHALALTENDTGLLSGHPRYKA